MTSEPVMLHAILILLIVVLTMLTSWLPSQRIFLTADEWSIMRYLPLVSVPLYIIYEATMPVNMNIRIDVFLICPMLIKCIKFSLQKDYEN